MKILPIVFAALPALIIGLGVGGATRMASGAEKNNADVQPSSKGDKAGESKHAAKQAKSAYFKFSRQFVAPVIENGAPVGLMILDVNLEVDPAIAQSAYADEPRLRDIVFDVLLREGASGRLSELFANPRTLEEIKAKILAAARTSLGDGARSVLIMDVGYQRL